MLWGGGGINSHAEQANKWMCGWQSAPGWTKGTAYILWHLHAPCIVYAYICACSTYVAGRPSLLYSRDRDISHVCVRCMPHTARWPTNEHHGAHIAA